MELNLAKEALLPLPTSWLKELIGKRKAVTTQTYTPEEKAWDSLMLTSVTDPHYIQSSAWGESKAKGHWPVSRYIAYTERGVLPIQVFSRDVPGLGRLHYSPEVSGITETDIPILTEQIQNQYGKGMTFKLELYQPYSAELFSAFKDNGWVVANSVQHRHSVIVDISGTDEELLARFKKRARYEVRLAQRSGVRVEKVAVTQEKLNLLASLMNITAKRSGAFFRKDSYSNRYWHSFAKTGQGNLYFAYHGMDLLAGAYVITYGNRAWYKDGGSVRQKSEMMGPRLLQYEIMRDLQSQGVTNYDLCGIPSPDDYESSPMKGLFVFKTGFSDNIVKFMPAMELPFGKRYPIWPKTEPQFLRFYSGFRKDFWY